MIGIAAILKYALRASRLLGICKSERGAWHESTADEPGDKLEDESDDEIESEPEDESARGKALAGLAANQLLSDPDWPPSLELNSGCCPPEWAAAMSMRRRALQCGWDGGVLPHVYINLVFIWGLCSRRSGVEYVAAYTPWDSLVVFLNKGLEQDKTDFPAESWSTLARRSRHA